MRSHRTRTRSGDGAVSSGTVLRATAWLLSSVLILDSGCASLERDAPGTAHQGALGEVALVAGTSEPEIRFEGVSASGDAAQTAGGTFLVCAGQMVGCGSVLCAPFFVAWLGVCGVASAIG